MKKIRFALLFFLPALLAGCYSTEIVATWKQDDHQPRSFKKLLVIGMSNNVAARATVEDEVVYYLRVKGIPAVAASSVLPPDRSIVSAPHDVQKKRLQEEGFDGVLAISLLRSEEGTKYVAGATTYDPVGYYGGYYGSFYSYYPYMYANVYQPGYYVNSKTIYLETGLYDVETGQLLWSAQSETIDPSSIDDLANSYARSMVTHLIKRRIIAVPGKKK